jgi:RNA polymerase sigma-70 factor, ECF subfamily
LPPRFDTVIHARDGDQQALERLVRMYQNCVARFVISQIGRGDHVEDVSQAVFVKMVLGLPQLKEVRAFEPWLLKIARHECADYLRSLRSSRRIFVSYEPRHEMLAIAAAVPSEDHETVVTRAMQRMPEVQSWLLALAAEKKRSYDELAQIANVSVSALKSRLFRAREKLRRLSADEGGEDGS